MQESDILQIVTRLRKLEAKGREVDNEIKGIRALLREEFERRGTDEFTVGRYCVRRISYEREAFDAKSFKGDHPKMYKLFCKPQTVTRIDITG